MDHWPHLHKSQLRGAMVYRQAMLALRRPARCYSCGSGAHCVLSACPGLDRGPTPLYPLLSGVLAACVFVCSHTLPACVGRIPLEGGGLLLHVKPLFEGYDEVQRCVCTSTNSMKQQAMLSALCMAVLVTRGLLQKSKVNRSKAAISCETSH